MVTLAPTGISNCPVSPVPPPVMVGTLSVVAPPLSVVLLILVMRMFDGITSRTRESNAVLLLSPPGFVNVSV